MSLEIEKITIAQTCEEPSLSKEFISNVENNNTSPSISILQTIEAFLKVPVPYLLLEKDEHMTVIRKNEREVTTSKESNLKVDLLASRGGLSIRLVEFPQVLLLGGKMHMKGKSAT